ISVGMLVDNGIVIVENIFRHYSQGLSRNEAARRGAGEVAWPVITSTMTTLVAFAPLLFWPGIIGQFMSFLPITLIVTLTSSL
ncbi:MAG: efflux RND transporter permease subunit, partial [Kiritimatiellia bacterium]